MNRRCYLAVISTGIATTAGCSGDSSGNNELIEETYEGEGSMLQEFTVENEGAVLFEAECEEHLNVSVLPADDQGERKSFTVPSRLSRVKVYSNIETGEYAMDINSSGNWKINIEQHLPFDSKNIETPEYPLNIETSTQDVFGPYNFDGFMSVSTYSTAVSGASFINGSGEIVKMVTHNQSSLGKRQDQGAINIEGPHWVVITMNLALTGDDDPVEFEATLEAPN